MSGLLRRRLLDPLELQHTFLEFEVSSRRLTTHGYEPWGAGKLRNVTAENDGLGLGDGGMIATACDVARFVDTLLRQQHVLPDQMLGQMLNFNQASDYGLGIEREQTSWASAGLC